MTLYGDQGTLKASVMSYDFIPRARASPFTGIGVYEREQFPEDVTEKDIELHAAPATRRHLLDFLAAIEQRTRPVADIEEGHISTASCIWPMSRCSSHVRWCTIRRPRQVTGDERRRSGCSARIGRRGNGRRSRGS